MKRGLTILVTIAGAMTVLYFYRPAWAPASTPQFSSVQVQKRNLPKSIVERGWLVSMDSEDVQIKATGEILEITPTGTPVKKGDVVIRIDEENARERLEDIEFAIHGTEQEKASAEASYHYTEVREDNRLTQLRKELFCARMEEEDARKGLKPHDRRILEIELETAQLNLQDAQDKLAREERLQEKGFVSAAMLEPLRRSVETRQAGADEIKARIRLEERGMLPEQLVELQRRVERIQALLDRGEKARERHLEQVQKQIHVADAKLAQNRRQEAGILEEIEAMSVTAPRDGIMSVRLYYQRHGRAWSEYKPGVKRYKNDRLADIVNLGRMKIELMIHESDIDSITTGITANVQLPAFPGKYFVGELTEMGGVGRDRANVAPRGFESGAAGVTMFNATVSLDGKGVEFRPGMSAVVELIVAPARERLVVPRQAVTSEAGRTYVWLNGPKGPRKHEISGTVVNDELFEITNGLKEGDSVVTPPVKTEAKIPR